MAKLYSVNLYKKQLTGFKSYVTKIKDNDDLVKVKERLRDSIKNMKQLLHDLGLSTQGKHGDINKHERILDTFYSTVQAATTIDQLSTIADLADLLEADDFDNMSTNYLSDDAEDYYYVMRRIFDLDASYLRHLRRIIATPSINTFHINCQTADNGLNFKNENDTVYGQSSSSNRQIDDQFYRAIHGKLKGSHITNNYFDSIFLVPKVGYDVKFDNMGTLMEPNERIELKTTIKYLRTNGVLFYTIPQTRLNSSLAMYLSKAISNITIVKMPGDNLERITIIGTKNADLKNSNDEIYQMLKSFDYNTDAIYPEMIQSILRIPEEALVLEFFRGSELSMRDVTGTINNNMIDNFLESQTQPLVVKDQAPLLPFNIGQIGLVLTSGCLDGVVEEMPGIYHVIKGMTTKVTSTNNEDVDQNTIRSTETISNRVKINIFTADGKFIELG